MCSADGFSEAAGTDGRADAGGGAGPSFVQEAETSWTAPGLAKMTVPFEVSAGDVLVAFGVSEDANVEIVSVEGGQLGWEQRIVSNDNGNCGNVLTFRGSDGGGAADKTAPANQRYAIVAVEIQGRKDAL